MVHFTIELQVRKMKNAGFTLVELLVSISIMIVMLGVGMPAFQKYGRRAELQQAATDIQVALMQAHSLALAPEADKPSGVNYYGVQFTAPISFNVIRGIQAPQATGCPTSPTTIERHALPVALSMTSIVPLSGCIGYLVGKGGEPSIAGSGPAIIGLTSTRINGVGMNVQINQVTGQVSILQVP